MNNRQAIVLAGGRGTRLRPYTTIFPKPLVPIGEQPVLEIIVRQLHENGFSRLTFAVNHLADLIRAYFGSGERWQVSIGYSMEPKALGTAGPISLISDLDDNFLVTNGDILTDLDFDHLWRSHIESGAIATIATCRKQVPLQLGIVEISDGGNLVAYIEKPTLEYRVSMGIYAFQRRITSFIPNDEYFDLPDLMKRLVGEGERIHCYDFQGRWLDIGNPDDYAQANEEFGSHSSMLGSPGP